MSLGQRIESALANCRDQQSFFQGLLHRTLEWPVPGVGQVEEVAYSWSAEELKAVGLDRQVVDGRAWQIQPLEHGQPWGIFVIEFKNPDAFTTGRGMASDLRRILRGLVTSRRKDAGLPSWKRDHLLFICTHRWQHYKFAYFRSRFGDPRGSRLTTFGWGPGTSNRTVCEFNLPALEWPSDPTNAEQWVADWAKAFDKERLTNDFFNRFDDALEGIKSDLEKFRSLKSAEAYTQAQLLLERLIFLYFLQNRGWLSQDRRYLLRHLDEHLTKPEAFTYYKEFLDKVFWALSTPPGSSGGRPPGIPFLNGGLFDDDEFAQPNDIRKMNPPLKVRNRTFQFVFHELLEAFNFTVTEDTPLNQEVAVDPEMLGKVFESIVLHAEQADPDATAPDKRKATGSYYTPRIVVHFICQEVLYQYLRNHLPPFKETRKEGWESKLRTLFAMDPSDGFDAEELETLKNTITPAQAVSIRNLVAPLKCCDPAVGSGAFPVGLLHELVSLRRILETSANGYVDPARGEGSTWLRRTKEDIVQNCLFGVDIQQQAIEICRLRLWLSLVVDYDLGLDPFKADKTQFNSAIDGISQLPNLEMNFHRGDSLHDHISGVPIVIVPEKASRYADEFRAIAERGEKLHRARKAEQKRKLRVEILGKRLSLSQRIITEELKALETDASSLDNLFHDETESSSFKRKRIVQEKQRLKEALAEIERDRKKLTEIERRLAYNAAQFYVELRRLEGADFNSPFNFAWYIDFPGIFAAQGNGARGGFDIIVGNPPFVTARNPEKRELWRERWPRVCHGKYHMLCPFFELSFDLLKPQGELGFIVSNGFAKREFGKPLIEDFFRELNIQKIVDCSGLMFPGHGTPTCLVFGGNQQPAPGSTIRNIAILPGGGDLRTPPEESPLWHSIEAHHALGASLGECVPLSSVEARQGFRRVHENLRIAVGDCDRDWMLKHPCVWGFFDWPVFAVFENLGQRLASFLGDDIGFDVIFGAREIFDNPFSLWRAMGMPSHHLIQFAEGDHLRNYSAELHNYCLFPYDARLAPSLPEQIKNELQPWKKQLEQRPQLGGLSQVDFGLEWFEFYRFTKRGQTPALAFAEIATHAHFVFNERRRVFTQTAPLVKLRGSPSASDYQLAASLLNSSGALFWLKQVCFNKGAGEDEERDRFVYAGNKVQQLPVPRGVTEALNGKSNDLADQLTQLSQACWERGQRMPTLALRKLFEKPGEAYQGWNSQLAGYVGPSEKLGAPIDSIGALREACRKAQAIRDRLRAEMIAHQEEMDWLVYAAYGLLPEGHPAAQAEAEPEPLEREQRPFVLWAETEGNYDRAVALIPVGWPAARKKLWEARLATIRDNEHIRRIEQPVYKRRWDEQWKVGNQWRCGPIAYAAEFVDAFEWWLCEKAEWWLEHKKNGGPIEFDEWAQALWKDSRVQAAWPVAAEEYARLEYEKAREKTEENGEPAPSPAPPSADFASFKKKFREIVDEETVPEGLPFGTPYDELAKKLKKAVPGKLKKVRGKLNVPRERFHLRDKNLYLWAGLQFRTE